MGRQRRACSRSRQRRTYPSAGQRRACLLSRQRKAYAVAGLERKKGIPLVRTVRNIARVVKGAQLHATTAETISEAVRLRGGRVAMPRAFEFAAAEWRCRGLSNSRRPGGGADGLQPRGGRVAAPTAFSFVRTPRRSAPLRGSFFRPHPNHLRQYGRMEPSSFLRRPPHSPARDSRQGSSGLRHRSE